ncbi:MAG TPA: Hsp20/alpha crystallin family protein [Candidatus Acidoferrum sp.]|nr:Hsp20/alpha crystallin family protein [Candidatus Acidoferrum sp.]
MRTLRNPEGLFENLFDFHREFNEMFNRNLGLRPWVREWPEFKEFKREFAFTPAVEAYLDKEAKKYVCKVTIPGIEPKELQIQVQANLLTIRGERKFEKKAKETELFEEEIGYGVFERTLAMPEGVVADKLVAEYLNGVLEITAPVAIAALPRKIEVKTVTPLVKQIAA